MPNLNLDRSNYQVQFSGNPVELSPTEFEILWQLANKPGKIFSVEDLCNALPSKLNTAKEAVAKLAHVISFKVGHPGLRYIQNQGFTFGN